jgi:hypothetical protein
MSKANKALVAEMSSVRSFATDLAGAVLSRAGFIEEAARVSRATKAGEVDELTAELTARWDGSDPYPGVRVALASLWTVHQITARVSHWAERGKSPDLATRRKLDAAVRTLAAC